MSNLTRSLAVEFGPSGMRVNTVCPNITFTELNMPTLRAISRVAEAPG